MNVKLIDHTQNPMKVIYIAYRTCYSKDPPTKIKIPTEKEMEEFILDKINKSHFSPLEHAHFTFAIEGISRACSHQLVRHRTGNFSQQSQRYVDARNFDFVIPESIKGDERLKEKFRNAMDWMMNLYEGFTMSGAAKEDARYLLPNATTTNLVVTFDLKNFRHFFAERTCKHAQKEIRDLAWLMMWEVLKIVPFADYRAKKCGIICHECTKEELGHE